MQTALASRIVRHDNIEPLRVLGSTNEIFNSLCVASEVGHKPLGAKTLTLSGQRSAGVVIVILHVGAQLESARVRVALIERKGFDTGRTTTGCIRVCDHPSTQTAVRHHAVRTADLSRYVTRHHLNVEYAII